MYRFIESIQLKEGNFKRLPYHQARLEKAMKQFYPTREVINLAESLQKTDFPAKGLYKCRVVYDSEIRLLEYVPYLRREIHSLKIVHSDQESFPYKPEDRSGYNAAFAQRGECDDVLMVRNGWLTDSSYANIALFDGKNWFTPRTPLILGVNRAELLEMGKIREKDIKLADLSSYTQIALFNAMIELGEIVLEVAKIMP